MKYRKFDGSQESAERLFVSHDREFPRFPTWIRSLLAFCLAFVLVWNQSGAVLASTQPLPTDLREVIMGDNSVGWVQLPDWTRISFSDFSGILTGGSLGTEFNEAVGYDLSRVWQPGETPDRLLKLGDIAETLAPQYLTLGQIAELSWLDLSAIALSSFPLLGDQTLQQLIAIVPLLAKLVVRDVTPVADLLATQSSEIVEAISLEQLLLENPELGNLKLNQIDLSAYSLDSIPSLENVAIADFTNWQNSAIADIPGLSGVPLARMPNPLGAIDGIVARIDSIWGTAEAQRTNTISGSYQAGFSVACGQNCAHIELDDLENAGRQTRGTFEGKQWISGKYQEVEGGEGCLQPVNEGREPTGRHPFGDFFKLAIWETDEGSDRITTKMFFRIKATCGATPYFIGPFDFLTYQRDDLIFVGLLDGRGGATADSSHATEAERSKLAEASERAETYQKRYEKEYYQQYRPQPKRRRFGFAQRPPCSGNEVEGISLDGLSEAIASIESRGSGGYMATGIYTCADGGRNCGRAIGKYQTMSYTAMMRNEVSQVSGGKAWLDKLNSGYRPTQAEIMRYYPPEAQERAFQSEVRNLIAQTKRQTDPRSGGNFTGDRLIERVTQKWFGGSGSKVDAGYSDAHGRLSLYGYGVQAREYYNARGGNPDCSAILPKENASTTSEAQPNTKGTGATGRLINPAPGYPITSGFGPRSRPCARCSKYHPAVDLGTPMNTPIKAADGGTVIGAEWWDGYGKTIVIDHGNGMKTRYSHLNAIEVRVGQQISQGQQIGLSGATGYGTGPHLDFGVYRYNGSNWRTPKGAAIDPQSLIRF